MKHRQMTVAVLVLLGLVLNVVTMAPDAARAYRLFDVDDSYSVALLHMNGADASTTFTDESGKTWTAYGGAQIDTAQSKFGGASGLFDGTGDYTKTANSADFDFGTGDFTIDFWMRRNGAVAYAGIVTSGKIDYSAGLAFDLGTAGTTIRVLSSYSGSPAVNIAASSAIANLTWTHVALVRYGNTMTLYQGGTSVGSVNSTGWTCNSAGLGFSVGQNGIDSTDYLFNGWIDEVRVSKGIARWTANFTPPTSEYPDRTFQTQTAIALTATAANYQTQTASALTATAANYQTQTAAALTATAANYQTQTAAALTATEASNYQTQTAAALTATAANYQTQTAAALTATEAYVQTLTALPTSTYTPTATDTATPGTPGAIGTPAFVSTITYGDIARWNALACIGVVGGLWTVVWSINAFLIKRRRP